MPQLKKQPPSAQDDRVRKMWLGFAAALSIVLFVWVVQLRMNFHKAAPAAGPSAFEIEMERTRAEFDTFFSDDVFRDAARELEAKDNAAAKDAAIEKLTEQLRASDAESGAPTVLGDAEISIEE